MEIRNLFLGSRFSGNEFPIDLIYGTRLKFSLNNDRIFIDVELIAYDGCLRQTILEGTRRDKVPEPLEAMNKTTSKTMFNVSTCLL